MAEKINNIMRDEEKKVQFVMDKFGKSKDHWRTIREKLKKWDSIFFSIPKAKKYDWMSNIYDPATHRAVMTLLSRVVNSTTSVDPNFDVVPSNKDVSDLIRSQMYRGGFFSEWVLFCMQLLVRGTSIGKISWRKETKVKFTLEKVFENKIKEMFNQETGEFSQELQSTFKGYQKKPKETVKYDGPIFETVDLFDFYPEPNARDINDGVRIFRSVKTINEFEKSSLYTNKAMVRATDFPGEEEFPHPRLEELGMQAAEKTPSDHLPNDKAKRLSGYVELLEAEVDWYNPDTKRLEPWILTIANQKVLVRNKPFPYWNTNSLYVKGCWIPILNEWHGVGVPELTECLQEELNDKKNQRIDNINQVLQPIFIYEEGSIDPRQLKAFERKPGGKLRTRAGAVSGKQINWDVAPDVTASAFNEVQELRNDIEEVTGAVKAIQPSSGGDPIHRTSSGLMLLQSMAQERIKLNLSIIEKSVLEPMFEKFDDLNLQFLTTGYKIFDPEGKEKIYKPEMIVGAREFRAKGSRYALDQQMKLMNLTRALESLGTSGIPLGELHIKFWLKLYDAMGFEDKDEVEQILRAEVKKAQQIQAQMAAAKAGGGQGGEDPQDVIREMSGGAMGADQVRADMGNQIPGGM